MMRYGAMCGALGGVAVVPTGNVTGALLLASLAALFGSLLWSARHWNDDPEPCDACGGDGFHDRPQTLSGMRFEGTPCMRCGGSGIDPMDSLPQTPGRFLRSVHDWKIAADESRRWSQLRRKYPTPQIPWQDPRTDERRREDGELF